MTDKTKICPYCGGEILAIAKKCKHCKHFIDGNSENKVETDVNTNSSIPVNSQELLDKFNNKSTIITIVVVMFIIGYCYNSSNSLLAGCTLESSGARNLVIYAKDYSCNNKYYDKVTLSSNMSAQYPNYYVSDNSMIRENGEYVCSIYSEPDKIHGCNEAMFKRLLIKNAKANADLRELNRGKEKIHQIASTLMSKRGEIMTDELYWKKDHSIPVINASDIIKMYHNNIIEQQGNQIKLSNGAIISLSEDGKHASIYDNYENPKYYANVTLNVDLVDRGRRYDVSSTYFEYTNKRIPADKFIKNYDKLRQFTKAEMESAKLYQ